MSVLTNFESDLITQPLLEWFNPIGNTSPAANSIVYQSRRNASALDTTGNARIDPLRQIAKLTAIDAINACQSATDKKCAGCSMLNVSAEIFVSERIAMPGVEIAARARVECKASPLCMVDRVGDVVSSSVGDFILAADLGRKYVNHAYIGNIYNQQFCSGGYFNDAVPIQPKRNKDEPQVEGDSDVIQGW